MVEVYRGKQKAEHDVITYATYVMFFPQLVAGPIERPQNLLHQFAESHSFDAERITSGLKRMAWGFFKKLVVADRLALYVNDVYAAPRSFNGLQLTIATFFFAYQIYCDFSGYSDIAIGAARVLGFRLMENFNTPYYSQSISEFWHRWHISLSTWFRDYVYIPLGGSRVNQARWCFNIFVTFTVSGLWHGANWTYVVWGALNGLYLLAGKTTSGLRTRAFQSDWPARRQPAAYRAPGCLNLLLGLCRLGHLPRTESWGCGLHPDPFLAQLGPRINQDPAVSPAANAGRSRINSHARTGSASEREGEISELVAESASSAALDGVRKLCARGDPVGYIPQFAVHLFSVLAGPHV